MDDWNNPGELPSVREGSFDGGATRCASGRWIVVFMGDFVFSAEPAWDLNNFMRTNSLLAGLPAFCANIHGARVGSPNSSRYHGDHRGVCPPHGILWERVAADLTRAWNGRWRGDCHKCSGPVFENS